jgi:polyphosphate kinase 2
MKQFESIDITPEKAISAKDNFIKRLDEYKSFIISNYNDIDSIDVDVMLKDFTKKFGEEVVKFFNIETFLRKVNQILQLTGKKGMKHLTGKKDMKLEFTQYYISLDDRIKKLDVGDTSDHFDEFEGEGSMISRKQYEKEKFAIQVELLKLQEWVQRTKSKVVIVFEGRDSAGKGSTIKRFTEYLNPKGFRVVALGMPSEEEKNNWFARYESYLPKPGEIVFFDRSWYNRAVVEPAMGYCSEDQYMSFMENVNDWEESLVEDQGITLIKFWFSITREKQLQRFEIRQKSPLKYWKFSPNDAKVISKWDIIGQYKNQMFNKTSTPFAPWVIINSNDKKIGRLNAMRYVLSKIDYTNKDESISQYYPEVVNVLI